MLQGALREQKPTIHIKSQHTRLEDLVSPIEGSSLTLNFLSSNLELIILPPQGCSED